MYFRNILFSILLMVVMSSALFAYPTPLNLMPVADMMEAGSYNLQLESDGTPYCFSNDYELYLLTQVGVTDSLEIGFDLYDFKHNSSWLANAKWLAVEESDDLPAVALGVFNAARDGLFSDWYVVAAKDISQLRLHAGYLDIKDEPKRGLLGVEYPLSDALYLLSDWQTGPDGYHTIGLYSDLTDVIGMTVYYAENNSYKSDNFMGLNLCWTAYWKNSAEECKE